MGGSSNKGGGHGGGHGRGGSLTSSYYLYAAVLAVKLLAFVPLTHFKRAERFECAHLSELRHLTPFWLVAALYTTITPNPEIAVNLLRAFVIARIVADLNLVTDVRVPRCATQAAYFVTFAISAFMAIAVALHYRYAY